MGGCASSAHVHGPQKKALNDGSFSTAKQMTIAHKSLETKVRSPFKSRGEVSGLAVHLDSKMSCAGISSTFKIRPGVIVQNVPMLDSINSSSLFRRRDHGELKSNENIKIRSVSPARSEDMSRKKKRFLSPRKVA